MADAGGADGLSQPGRALWLRALRARCGSGGRRRRRAHRRLSARGVVRLRRPLHELGLDQIFLPGADHPTERRARASRPRPRGFLYYVSFKGITGAGHLDHGRCRALDELRGLSDVPMPSASASRRRTGAALGAARRRRRGRQRAGRPRRRRARMPRQRSLQVASYPRSAAGTPSAAEALMTRPAPALTFTDPFSMPP
jgi:hypothetical protein